MTDDVSHSAASAELRDAVYVLGQYLSDKVAPLMTLDALTLLMEQPLAFVAREIEIWCSRQLEVQQLGAVGYADLFFHAARKIHMMGDFSLIPPEELRVYLQALGPLLIEACPIAGRDQLHLGLSRLHDAGQAPAPKVEIVHRQAGAVDPNAAAAAGVPAIPASPQVLSAVVRGLGRLPLLLQRLERLSISTSSAAVSRPAPSPAPIAQAAAAAPIASPAGPLATARTALVADALLEASLQAQNGPELEGHLDRIRKLGAVDGTEEMFRALGASVPGWVLPASGAAPAPEGAQVHAMRRMIAMADEPAEAGRRFRQMVHAAIEQFNEGTYGRALKMFELAQRMVLSGEVKAGFVEPMLLSGHEYLNEERVRKLAEHAESHVFLRPVLGFFRGFGPERLLDQLQAEQRRDRRRHLLNLLEAQGASAREPVWARLQSDPDGRTYGIYFLRNLVYLLKVIPRPQDTASPIEDEIDGLSRLLEPGRPLLLVKEALQYLVATHHSRAEGELVAALEAVEEALLERSASAEDRNALTIHLDRLAAGLARFATPRAWSALVEHALSRQAPFGDTLARLAELGPQDLSAAPAVVVRLVDAIRAELPRGVLGRLVAGRETVLARLVAALSSTRATPARDVLAELADRFPTHSFGRDAQKAAAALEQERPVASAAPSISGDLDLFGLPALLQNLSELRKTGTLNLLDLRGRPAALLRLESGAVRNAQCGSRRGQEALFQLIERPFPATFAFVSGKRPGEPPGEDMPLVALLHEGVRRHDELRRALALVPEEAALEATGQSPSTVPDELDYDLVVQLWQKACAGASPREMEADVTVDSYRVFHALVHWVEEGALRARPVPTA